MDNISIIKIMVVVGVLVLCAYGDIREKKVSVYMILAGIGGTIILNILGKDISLVNALLGAALGIVLIVVSKLTKGALGTGDAMLTVMIGLSIGLFNTMLALFYALLITSVVSVILLLLKRVKKQTAMPFVPFMLLGYLGVIFSW